MSATQKEGTQLMALVTPRREPKPNRELAIGDRTQLPVPVVVFETLPEVAVDQEAQGYFVKDDRGRLFCRPRFRITVVVSIVCRNICGYGGEGQEKRDATLE
jgi:hypothetical protein